MKVLVVGANGQIGKHLVNLLKESDEHTVRAMVRNEEQVEAFEKMGVETRLADLEGSVEAIKEATEGCDAVVFAAGSGSHTGADKTMLIDLDGAAKTIEAAQEIGIKRYVMVSVIQADNRDSWGGTPSYYMTAKHHADNILKQSGLTYTIVRPGGLLNEPSTGKINAADNIKTGSIPREDVAKTVFESLANEKTFNRSFDLISGETEISDALNNIK
ncbi:SDR family oxidoreductase [Sporosarcina sp. G11-34]|uniref:SDR family oxidoreductase n=1 Tax=Sporosarcina sp. G11-34 TaxID=2849605 RepID=UPI0022A9C19A|nr:SDR family oxidoreductase [Sporosarcina sp. G11-34]MCZ2260739.1 SDR family oxidoreductase [Sporosarcina sp. G11-34]